MKLFQKKDVPAPPVVPVQDEMEEYKVATFLPKKIPMTRDILRRQREEEIRSKYCIPTIKTGRML